MSYAYYQQAQPGWGTPQYQFGPPPPPAFQPQPSWRGKDFYRAHTRTSDFDPSLFDNAWNRVRGYSESMSGGIGVGTHEAKHWHRHAYGGIGSPSRMLPEHIGHAAAYEAYRMWTHNSSVHEPLSGDTARQREGLIGLAVGEVTRLQSHMGQRLDHHARRTAAEAAAETAFVIFNENRHGAQDDFRSRSRSRSHSHYGSSPSYTDAYAYDNQLGVPHQRSHSRHRSHSRNHSHSRHHSPSPSRPHQQMLQISSTGYPSSLPPGVASSFPGTGSYSPYGGGNMGMQIHGTPYSSSAVAMPGVASSYQGSSMPMAFHRGRSSSMSYAQNPYMGAPMSSGGMMMPGVPQSQAIVLTKPRKHKHHHHHHSRSRRSRSIDNY